MNDNVTPEDVANALRLFFLANAQSGNNSGMLAQVTKVDTEKVVCSASLVDEPDIVLENIRLRATDDDKDEGFVLFPKAGSFIIVGKTALFDAYYVAMFSEIENVVINGGKLGGLLKIKETVEKLNKLESELNQLKQIFTAWVPVPSDGGLALKSLLTTWAAQTITPTTQKDLENDKIKQ